MKVKSTFFIGLLVVGFSLPSQLFARVMDGHFQSANVSLPDSLPFPGDWLGNWAGELEISNVKGVRQRVPMALQVQPTANDSTYTWSIIYGEDQEKGKRSYLLKVVDAEKGLYVIDEQNTIALESYLFGDQFYSWYMVQGNLIMAIYRKVGDELHFEIVAGKDTPVSVTGNAKHEGEDIPAVETYPIGTVQHAILKRKS